MARSVPDLRGVDVMAAKSMLAAVNVNAVVHNRRGSHAARRVVRLQLPEPGTDFAVDVDYQVLLVTFASALEGEGSHGAHDG